MQVNTIKTIERVTTRNPAIRIPINPTLWPGTDPAQRRSEENKYSSRAHLDLIMDQLKSADSALLEQLSAQVQKVKGRDSADLGPITEFIIAEDAAFLQSAELAAEHNAAVNYINVYGPFSKAVVSAILTNESYYSETGYPSCVNWKKEASGDAYIYKNDEVLDIFGRSFRQVVLDRNTRGDEISGRGESLLPDIMAFPQTYKVRGAEGFGAPRAHSAPSVRVAPVHLQDDAKRQLPQPDVRGRVAGAAWCGGSFPNDAGPAS